MGLKEKRAIEIVRTRDVPAAEEEIRRYLGGASFALEVDWNSVETAGEDGVFSVKGRALRPLAGAMLIASHEDFVRQAFASQIKGARISHVAASGDKSIAIADGIIDLKVNVNDNTDGALSDREIYDALMNAL